jgi:predicted ATPase
MIKEIKVNNYKCLKSVELTFGNLNIITGLNSVGKSSLIQSILDYSKAVECCNSRYPLSPADLHFDEIRNILDTKRKIEIAINGNPLVITENEVKFINGKPPKNFPIKDKELHYLSATRIGPKDFHKYKKGSNNITGDEGELIFSVFENREDPIAKELIKCANDRTLAGNVNLWLQEILTSKIQLNSGVVDSNTLKINYEFDGIKRISPRHLGSGVSYLVQVIILCLLAKPKDIIIIENPEIHLHPAVQSKLGMFFAFIASKGIQVIIETHCEHLINRVRYEVGYEKSIESKQVKIFYKAESRESFIRMGINSSGHYVDDSGNKTSFPSGFFDSTLRELLELG